MTDNPYGLAALWSQGDLIIKIVAVVLLLMSIASWYVIVTRALRAARLRRVARAAAGFWEARTLAEGITLLESLAPGNPFHRLAAEGRAAVEHHAEHHDDLAAHLGLSEWLTDALRGALDDAAERLQGGLAVLASVGSTAPFVGLFGTVWGIYHALVGIGVSGQASVDRVAGPVGEALIMTAFGLAVAIPAVLGYNALTRTNRGFSSELERFARRLHRTLLAGPPAARQGPRVAPVRAPGAGG